MALPVTLWEEREKRERENQVASQSKMEARRGVGSQGMRDSAGPLTASSKTFAETGTFPFRL